MNTKKVVEETNGLYTVIKPLNGDEIINLAKYVIAKKFQRGVQIDSTEKCMDFLVTSMAEYENEVLCAIFLDTSMQLISFDKLADGGVNQVRICPRTLIKKALEYNATAVILAHNHPSGNATASPDDVKVTKYAREALGMFEITLLDHIVVGANKAIRVEVTE